MKLKVLRAIAIGSTVLGLAATAPAVSAQQSSPAAPPSSGQSTRDDGGFNPGWLGLLGLAGLLGLRRNRTGDNYVGRGTTAR